MSDDEEEMPILVDTATMTKQIPVSIMTGFLGSGKTTLLNYLLRHQHGKRIAIIENEFSGGLGIENMIAKSGVDGGNMEGFFELNNGCICCSVKEDLLSTLEQLVLHKDRFDYVLIETTGVANPGPIITSLWADEALESSLRLDGVITVVDSLNVLKYLSHAETSHDVRMQLAFADRILLNKSDLVTSEKMASIEQAVKLINSSAEVRHTTFAEISPDWVLDSDSYSLTHMKSLPMLHTPASDGAAHTNHEYSHVHNHEHNHDGECEHCLPTSAHSSSPQPHSAASLSTHSFLIPGLMDLRLLKICLDRLLYSFEEEHAGEGEGSSDSDSVLGSKRTHGVVSVGVSLDTPTPHPSSTEEQTEEKKEKEKGGDGGGDHSSSCRIYRMKGVFQVAEEEEQGVKSGVALHILQAVHDVFDIQRSDVVPGSEGDKSEGVNKLIVIGKHMDKAGLEAEFRRCLVSTN